MPTPQEIEDTETLYDRMVDVLDTVVGTFESYGIAIPSRQYITFGGTAHDCEQITASTIQMYLGPPGDQAAGPQPCNGPRSAVIQLQLVRCLPTYNARNSKGVDPVEQEAMTKKQAIDCWVMLQASTQFEHYQSVIADVSVTDPEGGYQAVVLNLVMAV